MALALMRRHRRWLYGFLWVVIAAFIILYIPAFQGEPSGTPGETVVNVGGRPISVGEYQRAYYRQRQLYERMYQGRIDDALLRRIQQQVLESLVTDRLVDLEAKRLGITVSDDAVARQIATAPEFQDGGRFVGPAEIRRRLELQGMTEEQLAEQLRQELRRTRLQDLLGSAVGVSEAEVERELARRDEQLRIEYVRVDAARFRASIVPSEAEIEERFAAHKESYRIPERRVVSYVLLDPETLRKDANVTDRDIEEYYRDHREDFRQEEQACASHILIKVRQGASGAGHPDAEARQLAQGLLDQLKAGADFAALAKKSSEDQGSAERGGDLGCFPPGQMVREFDDAVFDMKPGQLSDLVKTSFGYHVILLRSLKEATVQPLAQVKEAIRGIVLNRKLSDLGEEKAQALHDRLARGKSLPEAAQALGLTVRKSAPIARGETPPGLDSPTLVARVFAMRPGQVEKEGFAVRQGAAFVALDEVQPPRLPELKEVHDKVRDDIVEQRALDEARALAESIKQNAEKVGLEKAASAVGLVRKETPQLTGRGQPLGDLGTGFALERAVYSLPEKAVSEPVRVSGGWAVVRVLEKKTPTPAELAGQRERVAASLREQKRAELFRAFLQEARDRYTITRNADAYRRAIGEQQ
jgi:peptidyl-prolyl cis-trans isomerase D